MLSKVYSWKKYLLLSGALSWASVSMGSEPERVSSDTSLGRIILEKVLLKDRAGEGLIIFTDVTESEIQSLVKSQPAILWAYIKTHYCVSDDVGFARVLSERYSGRLLFRKKPQKITLVNTAGQPKQPAVLKAIKQPLHPAIVDFLIVLYNRTADICLVYYHIINEGVSMAQLERKNRSWEIAEFEVEGLE